MSDLHINNKYNTFKLYVNFSLIFDYFILGSKYYNIHINTCNFYNVVDQKRKLIKILQL